MTPKVLSKQLDRQKIPLMFQVCKSAIKTIESSEDTIDDKVVKVLLKQLNRLKIPLMIKL